MKRFGGFPSGMRFAAIPEPFLGQVMPEISDLAELKTTLALFRSLYKKRGYVRFVGLGELKADISLLRGLSDNVESPEKTLEAALEKVVERGTFLRMSVSTDQGDDFVFFLNTASDREIMARIDRGEMALPGLNSVKHGKVVLEEGRPDIFKIYEDNIGLLTPIVADELRAAQKTYPDSWIKDAMTQAANQNKRRWSYISAILERWGSEGKTDGTYRADTQGADPDKYIKGKYGHMVQR